MMCRRPDTIAFKVIIILASLVSFEASAAPARACIMLWAPVCAIDKAGVRKTFGNASCAAVEGAKVVHSGECRRARRR